MGRRPFSGILALVAVGSAGAAVWLATGRSEDSSRTVDRVIGVPSGAHGSAADHTSQQGVRGVVPASPPPAPVAPAPPAGDTAAGPAAQQTTQGIRGTDGAALPPLNTVESVQRGTGFMESIHRIEGVNTLTLRNLEVVLRMQSRTPPPPPPGARQEGGRSAATAAQLLMLDKPETPPVEEVSDDRGMDAQLRQQNQEGS